MTPQHVTVPDIVIGVAVVAAGLACLYARRRLAGAVSFLVFGTLLAVMWALMGAPDVALAEAALGTGVTGALFVYVITADRRHAPQRALSTADVDRRPGGGLRRDDGFTVLFTVLLGAALLWGLMGVASAPSTGQDQLGGMVADHLPGTGVSHPVTGILLNYRSYDTLLEIAVLFTAVCVVASAASRDRDQGVPRPPVLLQWLVRVVGPVLVLLTGWLLFAGSSRPGGAFQAGAVLAAGLILGHAAGLLRLRLTSRMMTLLITLGTAGFLVVAASGLLSHGSWLVLTGSLAGPVTVALETVLTLTIGVSLFVMYLALSRIGADR